MPKQQLKHQEDQPDEYNLWSLDTMQHSQLRVKRLSAIWVYALEEEKKKETSRFASSPF